MTDALTEKRQELQQLEYNLIRLEAIEELVGNHRRELEDLTRKRDAFASYGDSKLPIHVPDIVVPKIGPLEVEPLKSLRTGNELAADVDAQMGDVKDAIDNLETEAESLRP